MAGARARGRLHGLDIPRGAAGVSGHERPRRAARGRSAAAAWRTAWRWRSSSGLAFATIMFARRVAAVGGPAIWRAACSSSPLVDMFDVFRFPRRRLDHAARGPEYHRRFILLATTAMLDRRRRAQLVRAARARSRRATSSRSCCVWLSPVLDRDGLRLDQAPDRCTSSTWSAPCYWSPCDIAQLLRETDTWMAISHSLAHREARHLKP